MLQVTCQGCGSAFEARRATAKWCSDRCRKDASRSAAKSAVAKPSSESQTDPALVNEVVAELEKVERLNTFHGQLAVQLARRLSQPDESGISSLSKELRLVMAAALEGASPAAPTDLEPVEVDDEVMRARKAREQARQAAGLA